MLVKKVKVVAPDGAEPSTEERYILTVDIDAMAALVGLPSAIVRTAVSDALNNPNATYYGEARVADYFQYRCNVWEDITPHVRKLELDNIHLRVSERIKTDASDSFLIVPVSVTNPGLVGDLSVGYELIPHIVMEAHKSEDYRKITSAVSIFRPYADSFIAQEIRDPGELVSFRLVGFDLLLFNEVDPGPTPTEYKGSIHVHDTVYRNPNTMVYDFGYGVVLWAEIDVKADLATLRLMRNGTQLCMPREKRLSLVGHRLTATPHDLLAEVFESDALMTVASVEFAKRSEATPQDYDVVRWLIARVNDGYTGIGWRN